MIGYCKFRREKITIRKLSAIFSLVILIASSSTIISCKSTPHGRGPLDEFIYYADEEGLPVEYLEVINDSIKISYRARPAYSNSIIYLDHNFDDKGEILPFHKMDSFEISSVFHEGFHAYVDLHIKSGKGKAMEREDLEKIFNDALDYYTLAADGRKIIWSNYRKQASEEAMAIHVTNLIKYKIVYEKTCRENSKKLYLRFY